MATKSTMRKTLAKAFDSIDEVEGTCVSMILPEELRSTLEFDTELHSNRSRFITVSVSTKYPGYGPVNWFFEFSFLTNITEADGTVHVKCAANSDFPPAYTYKPDGYMEGRCKFSQQKLGALVRHIATGKEK